MCQYFFETAIANVRLLTSKRDIINGYTNINLYILNTFIEYT